MNIKHHTSTWTRPRRVYVRVPDHFSDNFCQVVRQTRPVHSTFLYFYPCFPLLPRTSAPLLVVVGQLFVLQHTCVSTVFLVKANFALRRTSSWAKLKLSRTLPIACVSTVSRRPALPTQGKEICRVIFVLFCGDSALQISVTLLLFAYTLGIYVLVVLFS